MAISVLLIDDDTSFCQETRSYLRTKQFNVAVESDAYQAFDSVQSVDPDIVILDVALQKEDVNGLNICAEIRQHGKYQKGALGIIMISGHHAKYRNWTKGLRQGADRYLVKPFELDVLVEEIYSLHNLIAGPEALTIDDELSIFFDDHRVTVRDQEIMLTRREFDLLAYLAKPPNKTRSRFELLESVWKTQNYTEGAVARCICTLRQKISPYDHDRFVRSVRGVGYRLNAEHVDSGK